MGSKDLTLAYDDDTMGTIGSKDVTLAYDDDAKGKIGFKDVTKKAPKLPAGPREKRPIGRLFSSLFYI